VSHAGAFIIKQLIQTVLVAFFDLKTKLGVSLINEVKIMKIVPFKFSEEYDEIEIYPLNDLHIGAKETDIKLFQQFAKFIKDKPNRYIVCIGDLLNNALKNSVSDVYSETMNPNEQRKWLGFATN
jgi:DNA polymerase II small subunit/DNA polymerase delta subunit B